MATKIISETKQLSELVDILPLAEDETIFNEDCVSGSKKHLADKSLDLMVCDPPFGINETSFDKHYNRDEKSVISGYQEAPPDYKAFSMAWLTEAKRVLKDNGSIYIISGWTNLVDVLCAMKELEFNIVNLIDWKYNFGVNTSKKYVSSHYCIVYATKSYKSIPTFNTHCRFGEQEKDEKGGSLLYQDLEDVWVINKEYQPGKIKNKNKLPEELIRKIVLYSSNEGDTVCDFFLGNFTTAIVAKKLNRKVFGFEVNKNSFDINNKLLEGIGVGSDLEKLKKVVNITPENKGKKISNKEILSIMKDYNKYIANKMSKKDAIKELGKEYKRGKFSILNIISKNEPSKSEEGK